MAGSWGILGIILDINREYILLFSVTFFPLLLWVTDSALDRQLYQADILFLLSCIYYFIFGFMIIY